MHGREESLLGSEQSSQSIFTSEATEFSAAWLTHGYTESGGLSPCLPRAAQPSGVTEVTVSCSCPLFRADSCPYSFHNSLADSEQASPAVPTCSHEPETLGWLSATCLGASHYDGDLGIHGLEYQEEKEADGKSQEFSVNLHTIIQTRARGTWRYSLGM